MNKFLHYVIYVVGIINVPLIDGGTSDVYSAPSLSSSDAVQFFYLETSFPYNTPQNIKDAAGSSFLNYGVTHAGLGIWDTTSDVKFSVEFISTNYVGGLLPILSDGQIDWNNAGQVVITNPLVEANWLNSRLVSTTVGSSWNQLATYLQDNEAQFAAYQPVTVMYINESLINSTAVYSDDIDSVGGMLLQAENSFAFVDNMLLQLSSYGCSLGAFLQIYATSFDYLARSNQALQVVSWESGGVANPAVYQWYAELNTCYDNVLTATSNGGGGAPYFQTQIKTCYGDVAYVYRSANSVYNVSLAPSANVSVSDVTISTPQMSQYVYNLPPDDNGSLEKLTTLDYFVVALFALMLCLGVVYSLKSFFGKKERRRVSFEGERIATRTVDNLVGPNAQDDHEEKAYYHGKKRSHTLFGTWADRVSGGVRSKSINTSSPRKGYHELNTSELRHIVASTTSSDADNDGEKARLNQSPPNTTSGDDDSTSV